MQAPPAAGAAGAVVQATALPVGAARPAERGEDFVEREAQLEALFKERRTVHGTLDHPECLHVVFALFDQLIALYRLEVKPRAVAQARCFCLTPFRSA
jgi:hypothetical protein